MVKKVLVPLDGSTPSEQVLPLVKELLNGDAERATLLAVDEAPTASPQGRKGLHRHLPLQEVGSEFCRCMNPSSGLHDGECEEQRLLNYLGKAGQPLVATGRPVCAAVQYGEPAKQIIDFAKAGQFDLIVMATHVRGPLRETLEDSVTAEVSRSGVAPVIALAPEHERPEDWQNGSKPPRMRVHAGAQT